VAQVVAIGEHDQARFAQEVAVAGHRVDEHPGRADVVRVDLLADAVVHRGPVDEAGRDLVHCAEATRQLELGSPPGRAARGDSSVGFLSLRLNNSTLARRDERLRAREAARAPAAACSLPLDDAVAPRGGADHPRRLTPGQVDPRSGRSREELPTMTPEQPGVTRQAPAAVSQEESARSSNVKRTRRRSPGRRPTLVKPRS
jgi:hypothetical protein